MSDNKKPLFKKQFYLKLLVFSLISFVFISYRFLIFLINYYVLPQPLYQIPESTSIYRDILIAFVIILIGVITTRYPLTIYYDNLYLSSYIFQAWQKRLINFKQINKIYIQKNIPRYFKWYTPWGITAMTRNMISSEEYEKNYEREGIWLETKDGKSHFFATAYEMYTIFPILKNQCKVKSRNIEIDEEIIRRYNK